MFDSSLYFFNPTAIPVLASGAAILMFGLIILLAERPSRVNLLFFLVTLTMAIWLLAFTGVYSARDAHTALFWAKAAYLGVPCLSMAMYHFTVATLQRDVQRKGLLCIGWVLAFFFMGVIIGTDLLFDRLYHYSWGYYPQYKTLGIPYLMFFFSFMLLTFWELWKTFRDTPVDSTPHKRARMLLIGISIAYIASLDYLPKYGVPLYPLGYVAIFTYVIITTCAIWRYRLIGSEYLSARLTAIVEASDDAVIGWDFSMRITDWNHGAEMLYGYTAGETVGQPISILTGPTTTDNIINQEIIEPCEPVAGEATRVSPSWILRKIQHGASIKGYDTTHRRKDGSPVDVSVTASPIPDNTGQPIGVSFIARDIALEKQLEALRKSEERQRKVVETALDAFISMNIEGKIQEWNPQAERIFGFRREEVLGQHLRDLIISPQYWEMHDQWIHDFLATGQGHALNNRIEIQVRHRDGHTFPVEVSIAPLQIGSSWIFNAFFHDISNRKKAEQELQILNENLKNQTNTLSQTNAELNSLAESLRHANAQLLQMSATDALTKLLNRRGLHEALLRERHRSARSGLPCCMLLIDLVSNCIN